MTKSNEMTPQGHRGKPIQQLFFLWARSAPSKKKIIAEMEGMAGGKLLKKSRIVKRCARFIKKYYNCIFSIECNLRKQSLISWSYFSKRLPSQYKQPWNQGIISIRELQEVNIEKL